MLWLAWVMWWISPLAIDGLLSDAWRKAGRTVDRDPTLSQLAECIVRHEPAPQTPSALPSNTAAVELALVRFCGDQVGLFDSGVIALTVRASDQAALQGPLVEFAKSLDAASQKVGAALLSKRLNGKPISILAVAATHRRGTLEVDCKETRASAKCAVQVRMTAGHHTPRALLMTPKGNVSPLPMDASGKLSFELKERGRYQIEILADTSEGPHVVSNRALFFGAKPPDSPPVPLRSFGLPGAEMLTLINQARAVAKLSPVLMDERLSTVAQAHTDDMVQHRFFAHRSPTTGDLTDRLQKEKVRFTKATENLAIASSARDAHDGLMASPGHHMNIVDPDITHIGVGHHCNAYLECHFVVNFAKLLPALQTTSISGDVLKRINKLRRQKGFAELALDEKLNQFATNHSLKMLAKKSVTYTPSQDVVLEDAVKTAGSAVAIDLFLSPSLEVIDKSQSNSNDMRRLGVGVVTGEDEKVHMSVYWITLVWAGPTPN